MNSLVTIAIPAYKVNYLKESIQSALSQTYSNLEVIVVDDCSPCDIKSVVDSFPDPRLYYYRNEINLGSENPARNWNRCLELSHGDFFSLLCDDDMYEPTFIQTMLDLATKFPVCNVFRARADIYNENDIVIDRYPSSPEWESMEDYMWHVARNYRRQTISEWMFRIDTIRKQNGYAMLPLAWYADYLSIFRLSQEGGIASSSKVLVHFRQSGINISSKDNEKTIEKLKAKCKYINEIKLLVGSSLERDMIIGAMEYLVEQHTKYNLDHSKRCVIWQLFKDYKKYNLKKGWLWHAFWKKKN